MFLSRHRPLNKYGLICGGSDFVRIFLIYTLMKHLNKYNEANAFTHDPDMNLIKEIILELKHEYPSMDGDIVNLKGGMNTYTKIKLKPLPIYNEYVTRLSNIEKRMKYFNDVIECSKRLQEALERRVIIENLFNENDETINIIIDDVKNKGIKLPAGI